MSTAQAVLEKAEHRGDVLYARVKNKNKKFLEILARKSGASLSVVIDNILDRVRDEERDRHKRKSQRLRRDA